MVTNSGAAAGAGRVRPLNGPIPLAVEANQVGEPIAMLWRGTFRRVVALHDTWRIDDEWWREEVARRYFVAELEGGRRVTVFRDLLNNAWYAQTYEDAREGSLISGRRPA